MGTHVRLFRRKAEPARGQGAWTPLSQNKELSGGVLGYVAQVTPQFDTEIVEKGHLRMETI